MDFITALHALLLGLIEGLTEFLPVSSTGHLILFSDILGFQGPPGNVFQVVIQLGSILAVCLLYWPRLWAVAANAPRRNADGIMARRFIQIILWAFLPAMVLGALLHDWIKTVLFSPLVVCVSLIVGGVIMIVLERRPKLNLPIHRVEDMSIKQAFKIGLFQCLALVPGVSRSGASILGAIWLGVPRTLAAEFSFFLAIPTMAGATAYDVYKNWHVLTIDNSAIIAIGFVSAFIAGLVVVRGLIAFVSRHGFAPFGWYRIVIGSVMLMWFVFR